MSQTKICYCCQTEITLANNTNYANVCRVCMQHPSFSDYLAEVNRTLQVYPEWRIGQTYFNVLQKMRPSLADGIRGTRDDPFHDNSVLKQFMYEILHHWETW